MYEKLEAFLSSYRNRYSTNFKIVMVDIFNFSFTKYAHRHLKNFKQLIYNQIRYVISVPAKKF